MLKKNYLFRLTLISIFLGSFTWSVVHAQTNEETPVEETATDEVSTDNNLSNLQVGQPVPEEVGDWVVNCNVGQGAEENVVCFMQQIIYSPDGERVNAIVEIFKVENDPLIKAGMNILTPLGTNLRTGLRLIVDDTKPEKQYQFSYCRSDGCLVEAAVFGSEVDNLKSGKILLMTFNYFNEPEPLVYSVSLNGFTEAWDKI
ncbi:MAG: invasion associated locus B family protein [Rhodobacteraceae bacterium]|nr:invasion associated locus B family protein [Paracoccaceae bacterium]